MTHTDLKPPPLRGRRAKRIAVAIAAPIVVLGLLAASPAHAFETRASKGTDNGAGGFASTFIGDDGALADCIQPGNPDPYNPGEFVAGARNITVPGNQWGGPVTLTDQQQAQINAINSLHNPGLADGSAEARAQRAAAAIVIKNIVSTQWEYNVLHSAGYNGGASDVGEMARWASYTSGAAFADRVKELANQYWAEAQSVQVGSNGVNGNPGTLTGSFEIDPSNNYDGKIKLETTGDTDGTWTVKLENGKFKDTGDASGSFAANGSSSLEKPVIGVPPSPVPSTRSRRTSATPPPGSRARTGGSRC